MKANPVIVVSVCALTSIASADRINMGIYENASGTSTLGLDLWVDVSATSASTVEFTFHNDSTLASVITAVYFENTPLSAALSSALISTEVGQVAFNNGSSPASPAAIGATFGGAWSGNLYTAGADSPGPQNGVNHSVNELLGVSFNVTGMSAQDFVNTLVADPLAMRMAQHVQGVGLNANSIWTVTVPTPGSLALLGLGALVAIRRRR